MTLDGFYVCTCFWVCFHQHRTSGPDPNLQEEDHKSALHKAAWNCDHVLMQMLLEAGADARAMDINGCAPIQYLLKVTDVRPMARHELCYQLLLNYNAARIYPPQFHKVPRCGLLSLNGTKTKDVLMAKCPCRVLVPYDVILCAVLCRCCSPATTSPK